MKSKTKQALVCIIILLASSGLITLAATVVVKHMNNQLTIFESQCNRTSFNEYEDHCICPCPEPTWIEKKLHLFDTCDGWIVKKGEACINTGK